jgi:hypothetical protein
VLVRAGRTVWSCTAAPVGLPSTASAGTRFAAASVAQARSVHSPDPRADAVDLARRAQRAEALERELFALRRLRAEVELTQPGLLLDRLEGWHSGAAEQYAERVLDVRLGLAGAMHLLAAAERVIGAALDRARASGNLS